MFILFTEEAEALIDVAAEYYYKITHECAKKEGYLIYSCPVNFVAAIILKKVSSVVALNLELNLFEVEILLTMIEGYIDVDNKEVNKTEIEKTSIASTLNSFLKDLREKWILYHT